MTATLLVVVILIPYAGSVFKSVWGECPEEWTHPQLALHFQLLRSVTLLSNKALEKARLAKLMRSSLEATATLHMESDIVKSALLETAESGVTESQNVEFSLADCLGVSEAIVNSGPFADVTVGRAHQDCVFSEEGVVSFDGGDCSKVRVEVTPISGATGQGKCPRCWKWVCPEGEELCMRCKRVENNVNDLKQQVL